MICGEDKPLDQYHKDRGGRFGVYTQCKQCRKNKSRLDYLKRKNEIKANVKKYRKTKAGKATRRREFLNRKRRSPEKYKANYLLHNAVRDNRIQKQACRVCGDTSTEGHHPDYSKPLEVIWLCKKHHLELHK